VSFFPEGGDPVIRQFSLEPLARRTLDLGAELGPGVSVSTFIEADEPIAAMRQMTWGDPVYGSTLDSAAPNATSDWHFAEGATAGRGADVVSRTFTFAEGATGFFHTYLLLANTWQQAIDVTAQYQLPSGATVTKVYALNGESRRTIDVAAEDPRLTSTAFGVSLSATDSIVAERAMWRGTPWSEGTVALGARGPLGTQWAIAEGAEGGPSHESTFVLAANASATDRGVRALSVGRVVRRRRRFGTGDDDPVAGVSRVSREERSRTDVFCR
jgi:hypothetical protein